MSRRRCELRMTPALYSRLVNLMCRWSQVRVSHQELDQIPILVLLGKHLFRYISNLLSLSKAICFRLNKGIFLTYLLTHNLGGPQKKD